MAGECFRAHEHGCGMCVCVTERARARERERSSDTETECTCTSHSVIHQIGGSESAGWLTHGRRIGFMLSVWIMVWGKVYKAYIVVCACGFRSRIARLCAQRDGHRGKLWMRMWAFRFFVVLCPCCSVVSNTSAWHATPVPVESRTNFHYSDGHRMQRPLFVELLAQVVWHA